MAPRNKLLWILRININDNNIYTSSLLISCVLTLTTVIITFFLLLILSEYILVIFIYYSFNIINDKLYLLFDGI